MAPTFYSRLGKRLFDVSASSLALFLLSPSLALIALLVRATSPGPSFFLQLRTGLHEKPFRILKFRTMKSAPPGSGSLVTASNDSRITPFGRWLRKTKFDELPQLVNVLLGHMSLVGPRPEVPRYTAQFTASQKFVFSARPGITGPSIILNEEELMASRPDKERFYLSTILPAKLEVDLSYCRNICFSSDLRLLSLTIFRLRRRHLSSPAAVESIHHLAAASVPLSQSTGDDSA